GGIVEVGLVARMQQRVVRATARTVLDDGRQADAPRPWCVGEPAELYAGRHTQLVLPLSHTHGRRCRELERPHALPIRVERVSGPLRRRREIELAVACPARRRDEGLEASVLP